MEVHFSPEVQAKLEKVASHGGTGTEQYVRQLVEQHLDHDLSFREKVRHGIDQLDRGGFLTHEEVGARLKAKFES